MKEIAATLLTEVEKAAGNRVNREGQSVPDRFAGEVGKLRSLPEWPFEARRVVLVQVSKQALVRVEGVECSVPSNWSRLEATACMGVEDIRITCFGEEVPIVRERRGTRQVNPVRCVLSNGVKYAHCLRELARKPQAVRQVAPKLLGELGELHGELWKVPAGTHGEPDAARVQAKMLAAVLDHGEEAVRHAIEQALAAGRQYLSAPALELHRMPKRAKAQVPMALQGCSIEAGCAADYDVLLVRGGA